MTDDRQLMSGRLQTPGHRPTHDPRSYEPEFHRYPSVWLCSACGLKRTRESSLVLLANTMNERIPAFPAPTVAW